MSWGTRPISELQYGLRGLWSQITIRPPGRETRTISASVRRTAPGVGDVVHRRDRQHQLEAVIVERELGARGLDRVHRGTPAAKDLEHPDGGVDAGHLVAGGGEPLRERAGPAADIERRPRRTRGGHERGPLAQVVLDDVGGQRLVVDGRDLVKVGAAHVRGRGSMPRRLRARPGAGASVAPSAASTT